MTIEDRDNIPLDDEGEGSRSSRSRRGRREERRHLPLWQETALLLVMALVLAVVIKALFVQAFYIPSESMEPGLKVNDRILVQKVSYWNAEPQRGDVVVFKDPGGWLPPSAEPEPSGLTKVLTKIGLYPAGGHLVKRVIGVAGDKITCCDQQGRIEVNKHPLDESAYVNQLPGMPCNGPMIANCKWSTGPVPKGHIFVMGDNRWRSADSSVKICRDDRTDCVQGREFVPTDLVVGKVFVLLWPFDHFTWVSRPQTFSEVPDAGS